MELAASAVLMTVSVNMNLWGRSGFDIMLEDEAQVVVETYFKNSKKAITAENNVVKMAKGLVARMTKGFTAPRAVKTSKSNKVTSFALAA